MSMIGTIIALLVVMAAFGAITNMKGSTPAGPIETGQYKNEDYKVPPADIRPPKLPIPETYGEARQWMQKNPIYDQKVPVPVRCEAKPLDLTKASRQQLQTHFDNLTGCLMRVWGPSLDNAGYTAVRPTVTIYRGQINSPCGKLPDRNAAYCAADQQVYYAENLPTIIPNKLRSTNFVVDSIIAHEFSHAIQARTGILISQAAWQQRSPKSTALEISRRTEAQADCWAAQFLQSVGKSVNLTQNDVQNIGQLFYSIGDDQLTGDPNIVGNHGRGNTRISWYNKGITNADMGVCNSYIAPASEVK